MRVFKAKLVSSSPTDDPNLRGSLGGNRVTTYIASGTLSGSFNSAPLDVSHMEGISLTVTLGSGPVTGTLALYGSNDNVPAQGLGAVTASNYALATNPFTGAAATSTVSGSQTLMFNLPQQYYSWLQARWTHTSGTGSIDISVTGKGNAN